MDHSPAPEYLRALALRVEVSEDAAHSAAYPQQQFCDIAVFCADGTRLAGRCTMTKGEPDNPVREPELEKKFFELGVPVWGEPLTQQVYASFSSLDTVRDMGAVAGQYLL